MFDSNLSDCSSLTLTIALGPLYTAAFGAFLMALSGVILTIVSTVTTLLPVLMMLALGACLVGPVLTSHLTQLAPAGKVRYYVHANTRVKG